MANEVVEKKTTSLTAVKDMLSQDTVKKKFGEVLGAKAPQFMTSIVNVISGNDKLKECNPNSIISAALVAATYDLPIDNNLGFSAIVPYTQSRYNPTTKKWEKIPVAQFQMMYKGFIQLAIRSGEYKDMNYAVVYEDELESYNPITGEVEFVSDFKQCKMRREGKSENVIGYYAWFKLKAGFSHGLFMSKEEVLNHAMTYSKAYRYDVENKKQSSPWSTNFDVMALKTVIKLLLSKWGILSIEMQKAIEEDQMTYDADGNGTYGDNDTDLTPVDAVNPFAKSAEVVEAQEVIVEYEDVSEDSFDIENL